jgi:hypothetical protein
MNEGRKLLLELAAGIVWLGWWWLYDQAGWSWVAFMAGWFAVPMLLFLLHEEKDRRIALEALLCEARDQITKLRRR